MSGYTVTTDRVARGHQDKTMAGTTNQKASCMLLKIGEQSMLVPRNIVAEIVRQSFLTIGEDSGKGLRTFEWRGCQVPCVSTGLLGGISEGDVDENTRMVIFYGMKNTNALPFYGFMVSEGPQLLQLGEDDIQEVKAGGLDAGELMQVDVKGNRAFIPKIDYFEDSILKML